MDIAKDVINIKQKHSSNSMINRLKLGPKHRGTEHNLSREDNKEQS